MGSRTKFPILKEEIERANRNTKSCAKAAKFLEVSYNTYKKYAKMYGLFEEQKNLSGEGIRTGYNLHKGKYALDDIIEGEYPSYDPAKLKRRLIYNGYMEEKCEICGFDEGRITDSKVPLYLNHKNGDQTDHRKENLELICLNCAFLTVGNEAFHKRSLLFY
jgi:hypothetical protein